MLGHIHGPTLDHMSHNLKANKLKECKPDHAFTHSTLSKEDSERVLHAEANFGESGRKRFRNLTEPVSLRRLITKRNALKTTLGSPARNVFET